MAFGAGTYVVTWEDDRTTTDAWDVYATRVSQSGTVLDPEGIPVATLSNNQLSPGVAYQGGNYLVVWQEMLMGGDIYGARLSPDGALLDGLGFPISNASSSQWAPHVAFDGTNALVIWSDGRSGNGDIYGARVSQAGTVLDPQGIAVSTNSSTQFLADVAFDGSNYMAVWRDERAGIDQYDIYGARISPAGTVLDNAGIPIATGPASQEWPSVAGGGAGFLVSWEDDRDPRYYEDIFAARVTHTGEVLDSSGLDVSTVANRQETPSAAFDGTNYLVAWYDDRNGSERDIYGARVTQGGTVLDPAGIPISTAPGDQFTPEVAFGGDEFLVTWEDRRSGGIASNIYAARVSQAGAVLDPAGIAVSLAVWEQYEPSIEFDGANYLIAWTDFRSDDDRDIYGARVTHGGAVLDPQGIPISTTGYDEGNPTVGTGGESSLVAWQKYRCCPADDIYGARIARDGTVLDPAGIAISTADFPQQLPSAAFDGTNYLVVWDDNRSYESYDIYGARVAPGAGVLDPDGIPISTTSGGQLFPSVAFDGANFMVVWLDSRSGGWDIYGGRVSGGGDVLEPDGIGIATSQDEESSVFVAPGSSERTAVAYVRVAPELPYGMTPRVFLRFFDEVAAPPPPPPPAPPPPPPAPPPPPPPPPAPPPPPPPAPPPPPPQPPPPPPPPPPPAPPPTVKCVVPRVVGLRLAAAKTRIRRRHCRLGRVRTRRSAKRRGIVVAQSPKAGRRIARGSRVNLVVGR